MVLKFALKRELKEGRNRYNLEKIIATAGAIKELSKLMHNETVTETNLGNNPRKPLKT